MKKLTDDWMTEMLGGCERQTMQIFKCKDDGCQVTPMGVNLSSKHYKVNTDWFIVNEYLRAWGMRCSKRRWIKQSHTPDIKL